MPAMKPRKSRPLTIVFVAVLVPAAVTLVSRGLRLLEQDRSLYAQRVVERQNAAADSVARTLGQLLSDAERRVLEGKPVSGAVLLRRMAEGLTALPASMLAWAPAPPAAPLPSSLFSQAESFEFEGDPLRALSAMQASHAHPM
ncbi:hypothetical protein BH24ACI5_BH24ACI5_25030 [soil metagenome]